MAGLLAKKEANEEASAVVVDTRALGAAGNCGCSVAESYGQPSLLLGSYILVGTFWILPVVYFLRFMPLVVQALQASMEQMDAALEEAAASLGGAGGSDSRA